MAYPRRLAILLGFLAPSLTLAQTLGETRVVERPTLHVVPIGINDYPAGLPPLASAVRDAEAIAAAFADMGEGFFGAVDQHVLTGAEATGEAIEGTLAQLETNADPEDTVVFSFSGLSTIGGVHRGRSSATDGGLIPYGGPESEISLQTLGLWLSKVPAQRLFVVTDAVGSPEAARQFEASLLPTSAGSPSTRSFTLVVPNGFPAETPDGGILTVSLVRELNGLADANGDGVIMSGEIRADRLRTALEGSTDRLGVSVTSIGPDFPLGRSRVLDETGRFRFGSPSLGAFSAEHLVEAAFATAPPSSPALGPALVRTLRQMIESPSPWTERRDRTIGSVVANLSGPRGRPGPWSDRGRGENGAACWADHTQDLLSQVIDSSLREGFSEEQWEAAEQRKSQLRREQLWGQRGECRVSGRAPELTIPEPSGPREIRGRSVLGDSTVAFAGHVAGGRGAVGASVNGRALELTPSGQFAFVSSLGVGTTTLEIRATLGDGAVIERTLSVERLAYRGSGPNVEPDDGPPLPPRRDLAVLFATDKYEDDRLAPLTNPIADAEAIAAVLRDQHGFDTLVVRNPTKEEVNRTLYRYYTDYSFGEEEDSQLFVFFAGHGKYIDPRGDGKGQGFVQLTDAAAGQIGTFLPMWAIAGQLDQMTNFDRILLVLDVCYGGAVFETARDGGDSMYGDAERGEILQSVAGTRSRLALTSGDLERVSDGLRGQRSPFAARVLEALENGAGADRLLFFDELATEVRKVRGQTPQAGTFGHYGDGGGLTFVFVEQDPPPGTD